MFPVIDLQSVRAHPHHGEFVRYYYQFGFRVKIPSKEFWCLVRCATLTTSAFVA